MCTGYISVGVITEQTPLSVLMEVKKSGLEGRKITVTKYKYVHYKHKRLKEKERKERRHGEREDKMKKMKYK